MEVEAEGAKVATVAAINALICVFCPDPAGVFGGSDAVVAVALEDALSGLSPEASTTGCALNGSSRGGSVGKATSLGGKVAIS
jgi:hypothetical protein